mmetsp:Transcript_3424/g.4027  ORF Transcript_3424/g.4027 Transcript_3424/m.4027 type:complete len:105 (-) Transcript_3424:66-380(-)
MFYREEGKNSPAKLNNNKYTDPSEYNEDKNNALKNIFAKDKHLFTNDSGVQTKGLDFTLKSKNDRRSNYRKKEENIEMTTNPSSENFKRKLSYDEESKEEEEKS